MKTQQPIALKEEHHVIEFRRRTLAHPVDQRGNLDNQTSRENTDQKANDLSRHGRNVNEPDNFRHRMLTNVAAVAFTVALVAVGIWLTMSITDLRKTQDCVLMGRRDCARISTPHF